MLSVKLDPETEKRLAAVSAATGDAPDLLAREALLAYLEDLEDYASVIDALREYEADPTNVVSSDELMRRYGLED